MSTVGLFANTYIALNHEWGITGNYAVRMHKTLKHLQYARAYAMGEGELALTPPPLSLIFYKNFITFARSLIVFAYFLLVNLST